MRTHKRDSGDQSAFYSSSCDAEAHDERHARLKPRTSPSLPAEWAAQRPIECSHNVGISIFPGTKITPLIAAASSLQNSSFSAPALPLFEFNFLSPHQTTIVWAQSEKMGAGNVLGCRSQMILS